MKTEVKSGFLKLNSNHFSSLSLHGSTSSYVNNFHFFLFHFASFTYISFSFFSFSLSFLFHFACRKVACLCFFMLINLFFFFCCFHSFSLLFFPFFFSSSFYSVHTACVMKINWHWYERVCEEFVNELYRLKHVVMSRGIYLNLYLLSYIIFCQL